MPPSGEKKAPPSYPTRRVTRRTSLPSTFIVYSSMSPSRVLVNTTRFPSGDTVASASYASFVVRRRRSDPSAFAV